VTFYDCKNLRVKNLRFKDAQQMHVAFERCFNVFVSNLVIRAPEDSPNTDGIHVAETQNIDITNSHIGTGNQVSCLYSKGSTRTTV
jgi:polygalacturonase